MSKPFRKTASVDYSAKQHPIFCVKVTGFARSKREIVDRSITKSLKFHYFIAYAKTGARVSGVMICVIIIYY
jgi:hypothetical protein